MAIRAAPAGRTPWVRTLCALILSAVVGAPTSVAAQAAADGAVDREFTLEASMLGFRGVGGDIDGVRNPVLRAAPGERVRITIVGVEVLPHDIALERMGVKSTEVVDVGDRASVTFVANGPDTYFCTIPGHRAAGMVGSLSVMR